ncbi:MAG: DUF1282 domain-containing protein [Alphaproteobacteria bacterium]|nr:DUF1282 domain-containing protein [Alphaproteobacteria bacterium]
MAETKDDGAGGAKKTSAAAHAARARADEARRKAEFILSRAYGLLRHPKQEWEQIRDEDTNAASIMAGYVAPLCAIAPIAGMIGQLAFRAPGVPVSGGILTGAIVSFIVLVAAIFFLGILTNVVARNFEATPDELAAIKLAAYAPTPALLLGIVSLAPSLWWIALLGLPVTAYLIYRGLPVLMKCPEDRAQGYAATVLASGLAALILLLALSSCFTGGSQTVVEDPTINAASAAGRD